MKSNAEYNLEGLKARREKDQRDAERSAAVARALYDIQKWHNVTLTGYDDGRITIWDGQNAEGGDVLDTWHATGEETEHAETE
jgi:hypothetical protein